MIPAFQIQVGLDSRTSSVHLGVTRSPIPDAILSAAFFIKNMSDRTAENHEPEIKVTELPLLIRDGHGKLLKPLVPNWTNMAKRLVMDGNNFADGLGKRLETRGALHIEALEAKTVKNLLEKTGKIIYQSRRGVLPTNTDLTNLAAYLDWSYQEQIGIPAGASNQEEASKHGIGAFDTWALFTSIKNKLDKR